MDFLVGMVKGAVTKETVLVNDTDYDVIIHDYDGKRKLSPGAS
jgi:hypothetical protein